ncbi:MAG: serine/threonine-protein kinase [Verrucomicrobiota bacterium]
MNSRYQIQGEINQGGVGIVLRAWDTRLQRTVAIKRFLPPDHRSDGGAIDPDLMREATVLSAMQHPNIVSIYDVLPDDPGGPCVVMEYLNGKDLEQAVTEAAITVEDFYKVAEQTLDALSNAHRLNLLHRDIKPANIQITWLANGTFICKFVDFGLARFFEKPSKQTVRPDGTVMGSVFYMAPEQLERGALDGRADLYSLGCVFYYLLSMHRPFEGQTVQQVISAHLANSFRPLRHYRPQLPGPLHEWVHWLMERRADQRPADAAAALAVLRRIQLGQPPAWPGGPRPTRRTAVIPGPAGGARPAAKPRRHPSVLRWLVPAMSSAALLGLGAFAWHQWQAQTLSRTPAQANGAASTVVSTDRTAASQTASPGLPAPSLSPQPSSPPLAINP